MSDFYGTQMAQNPNMVLGSNYMNYGMAHSYGRGAQQDQHMQNTKENIGSFIDSYMSRAAKFSSPFKGLFGTVKKGYNSGRTYTKEVYLPVYDSRNIGGQGVGSTYDDENGYYQNDFTNGLGLGNGKPLRTKHFSYYIDKERFDVEGTYSVNGVVIDKLDEDNTPFMSDRDSVTKAAELINGTSTAAEIKAKFETVGTKVTLDNEIDFILGVVANQTVSSISDRTLEITLADIAAVPSNYGAYGFKLINAGGVETVLPPILSVGINTKIEIVDIEKHVADNIQVFTRAGYKVVVDTTTHKVIITDTDNTEGVFSVKAGSVATVATVVATKKALATTIQAVNAVGATGSTISSNRYELYTVNSVTNVLSPIKDKEGDTLYTVTEPIFTDPYLALVIEKAKRGGYLSAFTGGTNSFEDITVSIAKQVKDTLVSIDARRIPNWGDTARLAGSRASKYWGKGKIGFAYNLDSVVHTKDLGTIFAVFQDRPYANAGGEYMSYANVLDNIPVLGETDGAVNSIGFSKTTVNGTTFRMGRLFKFTKDMLKYDNYGVNANGAPQKTVSTNQLAEMTDRFFNLIEKDRDIAYQLDVINHAGMVFFPGDAFSKSSVTKPVTLGIFESVAARLFANEIVPHSPQSNGSVMQGTRPVPPAYTALTSNKVINTLSHIYKDGSPHQTWQPAHTYGGASPMLLSPSEKLTAEKGLFGEFRFSPLFPGNEIFFPGEGGKPVSNMYYNSSMETAIFNDNVTASAAGYTGNVSEDFEVDAKGHLNLYPIYVVGKDSLSTIEIGNENSLQTATRVPGTSGSNEIIDLSDPFNQIGIVATQWDHGVFPEKPAGIAVIYVPVRKV